MWQIHVVSFCFLSTASSTLYTSVLGMSCCFYSLAIMDPLKPDLQNQLLFLCFNYWLVNTCCRQAAGPQGRMQSKTWLCLRSNRTWLCSMLSEYNTCRHAAKTDVCACVMKHAGMALASDWVAKRKKAGVCFCMKNQYMLLGELGRGVLNTWGGSERMSER